LLAGKLRGCALITARGKKTGLRPISSHEADPTLLIILYHLRAWSHPEEAADACRLSDEPDKWLDLI